MKDALEQKINEQGFVSVAEYLAETEASDTLHNAQKPKPGRDAEVAAIEAFMCLGPEEKQSFLKKALEDGGNWTKGAGVGDDVAAKSRQSLKNARRKKSMSTLKKEIAEAFPDFTEELQERFANLFAESVAVATLRDAVLELVEKHPEFALLFGEDSNEKIDLAEQLSERIIDLESVLSLLQMENQTMREEAARKRQAKLTEDFIIQNQKSTRKRSSYRLEDEWHDPDPSNIVLMESDVASRPTTGDAAMDLRVAYLTHTVKGRPIAPQSGSATYITETLSMFDK